MRGHLHRGRRCTLVGIAVALLALAATAAPPLTATPYERVAAEIGDDYDTWCENGSVCHRRINDYISETKGNGAYGDSSGVIGEVDVIVRTNFNGRQPRWTLTLIRDSGPPLQFLRLQVDCRESIDFLPNVSCGSVDVGGPLVTGRWTSPVLYGNRLENSSEYYGVVNGEFAPANRPVQSLGALETAHFHCYGKDPCYFPG